jgi:hypothetical protein
MIGSSFICLWQKKLYTNGDVFFKIAKSISTIVKRKLSRELRSIAIWECGLVGWQKEDNYYKKV